MNEHVRPLRSHIAHLESFGVSFWSSAPTKICDNALLAAIARRLYHQHSLPVRMCLLRCELYLLHGTLSGGAPGLLVYRVYDAHDEFDRSSGFLASLPTKVRPQALSSQGVATRHGAQRVALLKMQDKGGGMFGNMWEKVMLKLVEVKEKEGAKKKLQVTTLVLFVPTLLVYRC